MDKALHKKVLADLKKAGIASELKTIQTLKNRGWRLFVSPSYFDRDSDCSREIDIMALHPFIEKDKNGQRFNSFLHLCIEVKKTETPWVVCAPKADQGRAPIIRSPFHTLPSWLLDENSKQFQFTDYWMALSDADYVNDLDWLGTNIHESFKSPGNTSRWHGSFFTVCKALQAEYERHATYHTERAGKNPTRDKELHDAHLFLGAVVLDGPLYVARLTIDGNISLEEASFAPFDFHLHTAKYQPDDYRLDVVQINSLDSFLRMLETWHESFKSELLGYVNGEDDTYNK
ncbi:MAG: hypothetical protein WAX69_16875 [Victivallales bacterium]